MKGRSMGSHGRYGKYGEVKRFSRLRKAGRDPQRLIRHGPELPGYASQKRKKPFFNDQIRIIPARLTDADYIQDLSQRVFSLYGPYGDSLVQWFLSGMTLTLLALRDGKPVAFSMVGRVVDDPGPSRVYELLAIGVEPEMHKQGIGSLLMKAVERKAADMEMKKMILHTAVSNTAGIRLFRKYGFTEARTKKCFYPEGQDAFMMSRDLFSHP